MAKKTEKKIPETLIYIGKALPGLPRYTVFKNGQIPDHIKQITIESPHIAGLIVPISRLQESRKNMLTKGHILHFHATHLLNKEL